MTKQEDKYVINARFNNTNSFITMFFDNNRMNFCPQKKDVLFYDRNTEQNQNDQAQCLHVGCAFFEKRYQW